MSPSQGADGADAKLRPALGVDLRQVVGFQRFGDLGATLPLADGGGADARGDDGVEPLRV